MNKHFVSHTLLLSGLVLGGAVMLSACGAKDSGSKSDTNKTVTLTWFDGNSGSAKFDDPVAKEIEKQTGVKVDIQNPSGDPDGKLSLLLSSHDYPDIVMVSRSSNNLNKYISSKAFVPLNDLIDKYMPNVKKMYGNTLNKTRWSDGKNYYLANWYNGTGDPVGGFEMRYDYMKELVGAKRAASSKPFTQSEMIDILTKFKQQHPKIDGKDSVPLLLNGTGAFWVVDGMFGVKKYYQTEKGGKLNWNAYDPQYLKEMLFVNELHRKGLLDKEWVTNNDTLSSQKLSANNVLGTMWAYWNTDTASKSLEASHGKDAHYVAYKVMGDGVGPKETTYGAAGTLGWDAIGITDKCKDKKAAAKLLNFLASRKGQDLMFWGFKGKDYNIKNGEYVPTAKIEKAFKADQDKAKKETGITRWTWCVTSTPPTPKSAQSVTAYIGNQSMSAKFAKQNLTDTAYDTAPYDSLLPEGSTPEGLKAQKIQDIQTQAIPKMVNAKTAAGTKKAYKQMLKDINAAGLKDVLKVVNQKYKAQNKLWGE